MIKENQIRKWKDDSSPNILVNHFNDTRNKWLCVFQEEFTFQYIHLSSEDLETKTELIRFFNEGEFMKNKFNLGDVVTIEKSKDEFKIVGMDYNTYNKPKKIWYRLYRMSDGYICTVCESIIQKN